MQSYGDRDRLRYSIRKAYTNAVCCNPHSDQIQMIVECYELIRSNKDKK